MSLIHFKDNYEKMMNLIDHYDFVTFVKEHENGMDISATSEKFKMNCLHYYASSIKKIDLSKFPPSVFIQFLSQKGIDLNSQDAEGLTAMHFSIGKTDNHLELNNALISLKALTSIKSKKGKTPLWMAVSEYGGEAIILKIIQNLLKSGASLSETNNDGTTIKMLIERYKNAIIPGKEKKEWDLSFLIE